MNEMVEKVAAAIVQQPWTIGSRGHVVPDLVNKTLAAIAIASLREGAAERAVEAMKLRQDQSTSTPKAPFLMAGEMWELALAAVNAVLGDEK